MTERKFFPSIAELLDRLTVDELKFTLGPGSDRVSVGDEIVALRHDIDLVLKDCKDGVVDAQLFLAVIRLAQANLHIWRCKDAMAARPSDSAAWLVRAHEFNGKRNGARNDILTGLGHTDPAARHTNT